MCDFTQTLNKGLELSLTQPLVKKQAPHTIRVELERETGSQVRVVVDPLSEQIHRKMGAIENQVTISFCKVLEVPEKLICDLTDNRIVRGIENETTVGLAHGLADFRRRCLGLFSIGFGPFKFTQT